MNENENLEYTKEDLLSFIKKAKKLDRVSNKDNIVEQLRLCVNRVLDCNQYLRDLEKQYNKSRKLINKYAKQYKKEKDIKKYIKDSDNRIAIILICLDMNYQVIKIGIVLNLKI